MTQATLDVDRLAKVEDAQKHLATRTDVEKVRMELQTVRADLREETDRLARVEEAQKHLATRTDVEKVRTELQKVRVELQTVRSDLREEIAGVKATVQGQCWVLGIVAAGVLIPLLRDIFGLF